jgi:hypothetical protein
MNQLLRSSVGVVALVGFVLALVTHLLALAGVDVAARVHYVWLLHVGIFVVFIPFVICVRMDFGSPPAMSQIRATLPHWASVCGIAIFAYALVNFLIFMVGTEGGSAEIRDGKFLLLNHGTLIRELTAAQYAAFQLNDIRGFSGHWLVFYSVPAAYFLLGDRSNNSFKGNAS